MRGINPNWIECLNSFKNNWRKKKPRFLAKRGFQPKPYHN